MCKNFALIGKLLTSARVGADMSNVRFSNLFNKCSSLTSAPELPATTLATGCYNSMFSGCTKLNAVTIKAKIRVTDDLYSWLYNVASSGTITKYKDLSLDENSVNGIPSGWTEDMAE